MVKFTVGFFFCTKIRNKRKDATSQRGFGDIIEEKGERENEYNQ